MAISSYDKQSEEIAPSSTAKSTCSKSSNRSSCRLMKIDYAADDSLTSNISKYDECKKKKSSSPYLTEDRIQLLSRVTEKRLVRKKATDFVSSFPLAVNIYKATSDEFKTLKKSRKKVKKSVLTLPNEPTPLPQVCTVSDMNDSEYFNDLKDDKKAKNKKRRPIQITRKPRIRSKGIEIFDRDARYCSQLNIDLDSSSTETINHFTGDGKKISKKRQKGLQNKSSINPHDVWAMLRNMNRFQFRPSPPQSQESAESVQRKTKYNKRRNNKMDTKFIETCRTEQFTFFSSLVDQTPHNSQSSIDRITVIDKQDEYQEICEELKVVKNKIPCKEKNQKRGKPPAKNKSNMKAKQNNSMALCNVEDDTCHLMTQNQNNNLCLQRKVQEQDNKLALSKDYISNLDFSNKCLYHHNADNITSKTNNKYNDNDNFIVYANSDSSNGDVRNNFTDAQDQNKLKKLSPNESQWQINGITKVVLSKGENIMLTKKVEPLKRRPRLVTTIPNAPLIPKLTQTEIKRRLTKIKFPLVILGKDEVCSTIHVTDYEPPQFAGLDQQVWPFMQNWFKKDDNKNIIKHNEQNKHYNEQTIQGMKGDYNAEFNNDAKNNKTIARNNNSSFKNRRNNISLQKNKNITQPVPKVDNNIKMPNTKSMRQFKDRMLQFLYKKSTSEIGNNKHDSYEVCKSKDIANFPVDVSTNTQHNICWTEEQEEVLYKKDGKVVKQIPPSMKQPWGKGRWASEFIDNVIRKIKCGVYYNQEEKYYSHKHYSTKEDSVQTEMAYIKTDCCAHCTRKTSPVMTVKQKYDSLKSIPGFDETLSDLEVESINKNQVAIKHCVTNIIVQFDVAIPSDTNRLLHLKQSVSCIPINVTESQTKIFKSKTTIVNAMLPAELCTILPSMMRKIIDTRPTLPKLVDKVEPHLTPIAEIAQSECNDSIKHLIPIHMDVPPKIRNLVLGHFSYHSLTSVPKRNILKSSDSSQFDIISMTKTGLLPNLYTKVLLIFLISPVRLPAFELEKSMKPLPEVLNNRMENINTKTGMKLEKYSVTNKQVVPICAKIDFMYIIASILKNENLRIDINIAPINPFNILFCKNHLTVTMAANIEQDKIKCVISDIKVNSLYNSSQDGFKESKSLSNILSYNNKKQKKPNKYCDNLQINKIENYKGGTEYRVNNIKSKRRSFVKLYKKCKSMSSISNERSSMALKKIKNLDDFFTVLGSAKTLASVFDGNVERKILTSIKEMKNWIADITPRQALLVMLLANKKDTSNLVRYRPVILQGIAVNRITRATELDMEIEVIERENLNTLSQYEGISYLPASIENQDNLLEELHWIAKTTASDYQKPFDESSERLLKSLLEKRKKLNPSYLRVMARYVGLGLLKASK